ncbi:hypothetical protein [Streptomyces sp. NPDC026673]|uniref:hypothetical protein n=1 Tax=Streptomyces sp. NPDC026673 TaxID=3155724 RepID=UPI0033C3B33B
MIKRTVAVRPCGAGVRAAVPDEAWAEAGTIAPVATIADVEITAQRRIRLIGVYTLSVIPKIGQSKRGVS